MSSDSLNLFQDHDDSVPNTANAFGGESHSESTCDVDFHAVGLIIYLILNVIIFRFFGVKIKVFMILSILFLYFLCFWYNSDTAKQVSIRILLSYVS